MTTNWGHRWTDDELKKLIALWSRNDLDTADIAAELGVTAKAVNRMVVRMRQQGIPLPQRKRGNRPNRRSKPWTQEEIEYLFRRRAEGATMEEIASEMDRTFGGVQSMVQKLRQEQVPIRQFGRGRKRLWDSEKLRAAVIGRHLRVVGDDD